MLQEVENFTLLLFYLWAKYEPKWLDFSVKTLIYSNLKIVHYGSNLEGNKNHCFASKI